jgi:hypothetical protein
MADGLDHQSGSYFSIEKSFRYLFPRNSSLYHKILHCRYLPTTLSLFEESLVTIINILRIYSIILYLI